MEECLECKPGSASELQKYQIGLELHGLRNAAGSTMRDAMLLCAPYGWSYLTELPTNSRSIRSLQYILTSFGIPSSLLNFKESVEPAFIEGFADELHKDLAIVKQHAARKEVSLEFVKAWGNIRAAYLLLLFILHDLAPAEFKGAHKGDGIQSNQLWYALWVQYYEAEHQLKRKDSHHRLGKFLRQITKGERSVLDCVDEQCFIQWLEKMVGHNGILKTGFTTKRIANHQMHEYTTLAEQYRHYLPPFGEEHFPLK